MKNMMYKVQCAIFDQNWTNGLGNYTQANCRVTFTNNKYRIYRPPNLTVSADGNTMWGGLRIRNTNNQFGLIEGHTYIVLFDVEGQSSNAAVSVGWHEQMGWGHAEIRPNPTNVEYDWIGTNFNGKKTCWYKCTISDSLYKTCYNATTNTTFVAGSTYLSYADFQFGFTYESTGSLGTDLYISNIRMYDITNNPKFEVKKSNQILGSLTESKSSNFNVQNGFELITNNFYEL